MGILHTRDEFEDTHNVKVVTNRAGDALYFSREPIPSGWEEFSRTPDAKSDGHHRVPARGISGFNASPESILEQCESVDMNRVLENGGRIRMILSETRTIGVDTPPDLEAVEKLMADDPFLAEYATQ